jgi:hypothetical protein
VFGEVSVGELVGNVTRDLANPRAMRGDKGDGQ